jgi:hypothetical protein
LDSFDPPAVRIRVKSIKVCVEIPIHRDTAVLGTVKQLCRMFSRIRTHIPKVFNQWCFSGPQEDLRKKKLDAKNLMSGSLYARYVTLIYIYTVYIERKSRSKDKKDTTCPNFAVKIQLSPATCTIREF